RAIHRTPSTIPALRLTTTPPLCVLLFFHHPAPTAIYTLSLHDALPISGALALLAGIAGAGRLQAPEGESRGFPVALPFGRLESADRKSTRLNSSHQIISYAVFCLKKKKKYNIIMKNESTTISGKTRRSR